MMTICSERAARLWTIEPQRCVHDKWRTMTNGLIREKFVRISDNFIIYELSIFARVAWVTCCANVPPVCIGRWPNLPCCKIAMSPRIWFSPSSGKIEANDWELVFLNSRARMNYAIFSSRVEHPENSFEAQSSATKPKFRQMSTRMNSICMCIASYFVRSILIAALCLFSRTQCICVQSF